MDFNRVVWMMLTKNLEGEGMDTALIYAAVEDMLSRDTTCIGAHVILFSWKFPDILHIGHDTV